MKKSALVAGVAVVLLMLGADKPDSEEKAGPKDNKPPKGFKALFNGKDLTHWQGLVEIPERAKHTPEELTKMHEEADKRILPHWTVEDGLLRYDGKANSL